MEAARRNRARVAASRQRHGPAPRFTDADLARGRPRPLPRYETGGEELLLPISEEGGEAPADDAELAEDTVEAGPNELQAAVEGRLREIGEREAEIRERLLDIEASLSAIGASWLPSASRNPNRFQSGFDTFRLRAEQEELRQELEALAVERRILR